MKDIVVQRGEGRMGRDKEEKGRITGKAVQGWVKGGNCVVPHSAAEVEKKYQKLSFHIPRL